MRLNATSSLTLDDVRDAINQARGTYGQDIYLSEGWQTSRGRVEFFCDAAQGKYAARRGGKAASWVAWGYVIAELFSRDPHAVIGQYHGADAFMEAIYRAQEIYYNREAFGLTNREGGYGSSTEFLSLLY